MTQDTQTRPAEFVDSTPLLTDEVALRARAEVDGYLFFRGLLPVSDVLEVRADLLGVVEKHGWRKSGQDALGGELNAEAIAAVPEQEMRTDIGVSLAIYDDVQKLESVHRLPHHPRLLALYRALFGTEVLVHPRHIIRMVTSHPSLVPTPHHQDFPLIQGTSHTWTCWFPVGDCPIEMGGLTVLRGSHRNGYLPVQPVRGAGGIEAQLCDESEWLATDYRAGDVLTFPAYTVHKALPCRRRDEIRLSFDVRHQPVGDKIESRSLLPHCDLEWEEIYAGWARDELKYYWKKQEYSVTAWDEGYIQPARRIC